MVFTTTPSLTWKICCDDFPSSKLEREHSQLHVRGERKMRQTFSMAHLSTEGFCLPLPISIRVEVLLRSAERSEQCEAERAPPLQALFCTIAPSKDTSLTFFPGQALAYTCIWNLWTSFYASWLCKITFLPSPANQGGPCGPVARRPSLCRVRWWLKDGNRGGILMAKACPKSAIESASPPKQVWYLDLLSPSLQASQDVQFQL